MLKNKKTFIIGHVVLVALMLALTFGLVACGGGQSSGDVEFIIANGAEPESLDPHLISGVVENRVYQTMFEGLFLSDPQTSEPINGLVESYTVNDDGTVYQFVLREGLVWSDGEAITTEDVVFSLRRVLDPALASPYAWFPALFLKNGDAYNKGEASAEELGVRAIDNRTFELELVGPLPYVLDALTHYAFGVVPKHTIEAYGSDWTKQENIVGSGPFTLKEWAPQDKLVVEKNPSYWNADSVELDRVVFIASDDMNTNYNAYINGEVDWTTRVPPGRLDEAKLRDDYYVHPILGTYYYSLQANIPMLSDVRVREALARSIDKVDLIENVLRGGDVLTNAFVPPINGYTPVEGLSYDVEKAQQLFADAGYPDGAGFPEITILYNTNEAHKKVAEFIQQEWLENLGVRVSLENMEWKTFLKVRRAGDFQIARNGWIGDYLDPNTFLELYVTGGGSNEIQYANSEYDRLLATASQTRDQQERFRLMKEAESLLVEKDVAIIPIYYYAIPQMFNNERWEGFYGNIGDEHLFQFIKPKK